MLRKKWHIKPLLVGVFMVFFFAQSADARWVLLDYFTENSWSRYYNSSDHTYCLVVGYTYDIWGPSCENEVDFGYYKAWWKNRYASCVDWSGEFLDGCVPDTTGWSPTPNTLFTEIYATFVWIDDDEADPQHPPNGPPGEGGGGDGTSGTSGDDNGDPPGPNRGGCDTGNNARGEDEICLSNEETADTCVADPNSVVSGNHHERDVDLQFNTSFALGFKFARVYNSRNRTDSLMGYGWGHNFQIDMQYISVSNLILIRDEGKRLRRYWDLNADNVYHSYYSDDGYVIAETDGTFTWHRSNNVQYAFNDALQLISKTDGHGNVQSLSYDAVGRLETVTDLATSRSISLVYTIEGKIDHVAGPVTAAVPDGIWVRYEYDSEGNLTRAEYADDDNGSVASGFEYKYEDPYDVHNLTEKGNLAGEFISSWAYDSQDRMIDNVTRDGKGATISYGMPYTVVTNAQGVQKTYTIEQTDEGKRIVEVSQPGGCSSCGGNDAVRYDYDDVGRIIEIEHANGRIDQFTDFDEYHRYLTEIQGVGTVDERTIHYTLHPDTGQRLSIIESSILGSGDKETIFDYDDDGNPTPNENPTRLMHRKIERGFTFNSAGEVTPYEYITTYDYNARGQVTEIDGPLPGDQDKITYTYDPVTGDRLTETRPLVGTTTYGYDGAGNVETITDVNNMVTTTAYDGRNRLLSTTRNGVTTDLTYTAAGELDTVTDALNRTMDYAYNSAGFVEKITDPSGNFMYYGYNALGQRIEDSVYTADSTQTLFRGTDYGDPAGNPDLVAGKPWKSIRRNADDSADLETVYAYDSSGNLTSVTDAKGNVTTYLYDLFNRLYQVIQPGDVTTTYTYDAHGNLNTVTDAEGHVTTYTYDDLGRLVNTDSPDTGITRYSYDEAGSLLYKVQNSNSIAYQYDLLGRLTNIIYADTTQNVTMTYDSGAGANLMGRLASVTDPSGDVEYSYDDDGNLEMETRTVNGVAFVTGYSYDDAGNLRSITYPTGHTIDYLPDTTDPGLIAGVVLDGNQTLASNITYAPFGPVKTMTLGNGIQTSRIYDKNYQVLTMAAGTAMDRTYSPDAVGNIEVITDNLDSTRSQSFGYDDLYRLTNADGIYGTVDFTYDQVGNRTSRIRTGGSPSDDSYYYMPGTNLLQTVVGTHAELIAYDADGNTTARTPTAANPVPAITDPADYTYNSGGQRALKDATSDKIFHYDLAGQLIAETDGLGNLIKAYVWLHGQPLAQIAADGSVTYYHNDHLGTPQKMTDSSGSLVWAADYLPFGQADVIVGTVENNLRFAGQYYDQETGLHYNYHRYYDPSLGRYLRADPIGLAGGMNLFNYANANPVNYIDPFGLVTDPKHALGSCSPDKSCSHNIGILKAYMRDVFLRFTKDFTPKLRQLALKGEPHPSPDYKNYTESWNKHRIALRDRLNVVYNSIHIILSQYKQNKCCDGDDDFFDKKFRWIIQDYQRIKSSMPEELSKELSPEVKIGIVTGVIGVVVTVVNPPTGIQMLQNAY